MADLAGLLVEAAGKAALSEAVCDGVRSASFAQLAERVGELATGLEARGVGPGVRVAILARNRLEYVESYFALASLGAVALPINWRLRASEVTFVLEDSGARLILCEQEYLSLCPASGFELLTLDKLDELRSPGGPSLAERLEREPVDPDSAAVQMYTSGTTGLPKGAMLSHAGILALLPAWQAETDLREGECFLQVTPFFHVGGMLMILTCVRARVRLRTMAEFLPRPALDILVAERVHAALFVPTMVRWLLGELGHERPDFEQLRLIIYGAAPMPVPLLEDALAVFGCDFLQGYGLTETAGIISVLRPADHRWPAGQVAPAHLASAGKPIACTQVRLVDEQDRDVAAGEVGEVLARGGNIMLGYWNRPEANAQDLRDGWLRTGDLARCDEHGFIFLVDRSKDMVCVAGENVYPREIEDVLLAHPEVEDAAVIGVPHAHFGEEVLALVVSKGSTPEHFDRALIQHCRGQLARFKCPTRVEIRESLPRNAAGKLLKKELREPYWHEHERRV